MGIFFGIFMLIIGVVILYASGLEQVILAGEERIAIGVSIFSYIIGFLVVRYEMERTND